MALLFSAYTIILVGSLATLIISLIRLIETKDMHFKTRTYLANRMLVKYGCLFKIESTGEINKASVYAFEGITCNMHCIGLVDKDPKECDEEFLSKIKYSMFSDLEERRSKINYVKSLKKKLKKVGYEIEALKK